ncbi:MAG: c-type cytochrome [Gammaproteobacteria bacterium]|nr:c-type cytochrome [Gammaproteobacteria bacterium]
MLLTTGIVSAELDSSVDELLRNKGCYACHSVDQKRVGPAYKEIAAKYAGDKSANATLADKVYNGGSGAWGPTPMIPHKHLSKDDIQTMVDGILKL